VAVGGAGGYVAASARPLSSVPAWNLIDLDRSSLDNNGSPQLDGLSGVSCASSTFCVAPRASFNNTDLEVSLNPAAAMPQWGTRRVGEIDVDFFRQISCPSRSLCVAADPQFGKVATSTDAGAHWKLTTVLPNSELNGSLTPSVNGVSCPTKRFCVAVDDHRQVLATHNPTGGRKAWHLVRLGPGHSMFSIHCASQSLCVGLGEDGRVQVSTDPAGPPSAWKFAPITSRAVDASCPSTRLCLLIASGGSLIVGRR